MTHHDYGYLRENFEKSYLGWIRKIRKFILVIILFSLKNDNLGLQMKILKFLGIQPTSKIKCSREFYRVPSNVLTLLLDRGYFPWISSI